MPLPPTLLDGLEGRRVEKEDCCCWGLIRWRLVFNQHHGNDDARTKPPPDPLPPTPSSGLRSPPAQPICWRLGTCLGLPRWDLAPPRPGGGERRVSLGRNYRTPYREGLTLEKAQKRLRRHREVANPSHLGSTLLQALSHVITMATYTVIIYPTLKKKDIEAQRSSLVPGPYSRQSPLFAAAHCAWSLCL